MTQCLHVYVIYCSRLLLNAITCCNKSHKHWAVNVAFDCIMFSLDWVGWFISYKDDINGGRITVGYEDSCIMHIHHYIEHSGVPNHQSYDWLLSRLFSADEIKHQSSLSLAFVRGIGRWPVNSPQKGPLTRKIFPFSDVIMTQSRIVYGYPSVSTINGLQSLAMKLTYTYNPRCFEIYIVAMDICISKETLKTICSNV